MTNLARKIFLKESIDETVDPDEVLDRIVFHDHLNPLLWDGDELRLEVRVRLMRAALAFYKFIDLPKLVVSDIILTGSNAAYNYTDLSDIDVHLIVDYEKSMCPDIAENFFNTKRNLWNQSKEITIHTFGVELYVEDQAEPVKASGVFSLLNNKWLKTPSTDVPSWDDTAIIAKVDAYVDVINDTLEHEPTPEQIYSIIDSIMNLRKKGLAKGGEFSNENLSYKALRNLGYMDRLWDTMADIENKDLSL